MSCDNSFDLIDYRLNEEVVIVISVYEVSQYHARGNLIAFRIRYLCDKMFHSKKVNKGLSLLCHTILHEYGYGHRDVNICMHVTVKGQTLIYVPLE